MSKELHKQVTDEDVVALDEQNVCAEQKLQETNLTENSDEIVNLEGQPELKIEEKDDAKKGKKRKKKNLDTEVTNEKDQKKKLDEIEQTVSKQSSKKKKLLNWGFFALNIVVVAALLAWQLSKEKVVSPAGIQFHALPVIVLLIVFIFNLLVDAFVISYLMKINTGKWRFGLAYKTNAIGRYYDAVTPMATGGQPFQITYLKSHDVPLHTAMSIPLTKMVFQQICWILISFICIIIAFTGNQYNSFVGAASIIGFILGSFMLFLILFLSISKTWGKKVIVMFLKLLQKMKILKSYEKQYEKIMKTVEDYQTVMRHFAKSPKDFLIIFSTYMVRMLSLFCIPYLVFSLFHGFDGSLFGNFFIMAVLIDLASSFFPLPGATGMSEVTFSAMFEAWFSGGYLIWALLIWRFFSYYFYLVQGIIIVSYDQIYGNRKYKWLQRKETLVEESLIFKQEQINKFRAERNKQRRAQNRRMQKKKGVN